MQYVDSWSHQFLSWTSQRDFPILVIRYENLKEKPTITFEKIVRFGEWEFDHARLERAISTSDFRAIQRAESETAFEEKSFVATSGQFFRRGETGTWSKILNANQIASITASHGPTMHEFGYAT